MPNPVENEFSPTTWTNTTIQMLSPHKLLVESATMIFIISFLLLNVMVLIWKGPTLDPVTSMLGLFAVFATLALAIKQYASFR